MNPDQDFLLKIRPATNEDISFIFNSWLRSYRESGHICKNVTNDIYFHNHHKILQKILTRATCLIACNPQDSSQIYGYAVGEKIDGVLVMHYIYVKHSFRKLGIAKELLNQFEHSREVGSCYTHQTRVAEFACNKYNMLYHPYIILLNYEAHKNTDVNVNVEPGNEE